MHLSKYFILTSHLKHLTELDRGQWLGLRRRIVKLCNLSSIVQTTSIKWMEANWNEIKTVSILYGFIHGAHILRKSPRDCLLLVRLCTRDVCKFDHVVINRQQMTAACSQVPRLGIRWLYLIWIHRVSHLISVIRGVKTCLTGLTIIGKTNRVDQELELNLKRWWPDAFWV